MALATYADLQTQVANWMKRSDLTANIPDFITIFEAVANRRLRVRQMELSTTLTPSSGSVALPADYLSWRRVTWTGNVQRELEYALPDYCHALFPSNPADIPRMFTIEGSTLSVFPLDNTALQFVYFQKIAALSSGTNWLMTAYPDLYLFGTLAEAYGFIKDPDNMGLWGERRESLFDEIIKLDQRTRGPSAIRVMGWTP